MCYKIRAAVTAWTGCCDNNLPNLVLGTMCPQIGGEMAGNPLQWTVMIYMASDTMGKLDAFAKQNIRQVRLGAGKPSVYVTAQMDPSSGNTIRYALNPETGELQQKDDLGENINSGSFKELLKFIQWSTEGYPADNYVVIVWGDGAGLDFEGWKAGGAQGEDPSTHKEHGAEVFLSENIEWIGGDYTSQDYISNEEMKQVLAVATKTIFRQSKIAVLGFDACLMAMTEIVYEFRDFVQVLVASEFTTPTPGWPYGVFLRELNGNPALAATELGKLMVNSYKDYYVSQRESVTLSACDLGSASALASAVRDLRESLVTSLHDDSIAAVVFDVRSAAVEYHFAGYIDLASFCAELGERIQATPEATYLKQACEEVVKAIAKMVIDVQSSGKGMSGSSGLTIYFPTNANTEIGASSKSDESSPEVGIAFKPDWEKYKNLDFVKETGWDQFLQEFASKFGQSGQESGVSDEDVRVRVEVIVRRESK
jgi:hypothetical protein